MEFNLYFFEGPGKVPQGPVPSFELVGMCSGATGSAEGVTMDTLVWTEGMGDWEEFRVVNELMGLYEMVQRTRQPCVLTLGLPCTHNCVENALL